MTNKFGYVIINNILKLSVSQLSQYIRSENYRSNVGNFAKNNKLKLTIDIFDYGGIHNIYILCNVDYLYFNFAKNILDICCLTQLTHLQIYNCKNIKDVSTLKKLQKIYFDSNIYGIHLLKSLNYHCVNVKRNKLSIIKIDKSIFKLNKYKKINKMNIIQFYDVYNNVHSDGYVTYNTNLDDNKCKIFA